MMKRVKIKKLLAAMLTAALVLGCAAATASEAGEEKHFSAHISVQASGDSFWFGDKVTLTLEGSDSANMPCSVRWEKADLRVTDGKDDSAWEPMGESGTKIEITAGEDTAAFGYRAVLTAENGEKAVSAICTFRASEKPEEKKQEPEEEEQVEAPEEQEPEEEEQVEAPEEQEPEEKEQVEASEEQEPEGDQQDETPEEQEPEGDQQDEVPEEEGTEPIEDVTSDETPEEGIGEGEVAGEEGEPAEDGAETEGDGSDEEVKPAVEDGEPAEDGAETEGDGSDEGTEPAAEDGEPAEDGAETEGDGSDEGTEPAAEEGEPAEDGAETEGDGSDEEVKPAAEDGEPEEEQAVVLTEEELQEQGYIQANVIREDGTALYADMDDAAEPAAVLEAGAQLWLKPVDEIWGQIQLTTEEGNVVAGFVKLEDLAAYVEEEPEEPLPIRTVRITSSLGDEKTVYEGTEVVLTAVLEGFLDSDVYTVQWQYTADEGATFRNVENGNEMTCRYVIDEETFTYGYRVMITLKAPEPAEEEPVEEPAPTEETPAEETAATEASGEETAE